MGTKYNMLRPQSDSSAVNDFSRFVAKRLKHDGGQFIDCAELVNTIVDALIAIKRDGRVRKDIQDNYPWLNAYIDEEHDMGELSAQLYPIVTMGASSKYAMQYKDISQRYFGGPN